MCEGLGGKFSAEGLLAVMLRFLEVSGLDEFFRGWGREENLKVS